MAIDDVGTLIEKLTKELTFTTISMKVEILQSFNRDGRSATPVECRIEELYTATNRGHRFFDHLRFDKGGTNLHRAGYSDGSKCAAVDYRHDDPNRQESIVISHLFLDEMKHGFLAAPAPYRYSHVGLVPLRKALSEAQYMGRGEAIGRECDLFHFKAVGPATKPQSLLYSLDRQTAVPLKVEAYDGPNGLPEKMPNWVWEARTLDKVGNRHFPLMSTYTSYIKAKNSDGVSEILPTLSQTIKVSRIEFDSAISNATFWPVYQPGIDVMDPIAHRTAQVNSGETGKVTSKQAASEPIRVQEPGDGSLLLAASGVGLSLVVLFVAFLLWKRAT